MTQTSTSTTTVFRRVVTGVRDGRTIVISDGPAPTEHTYAHTPGMATATLWSTDTVPAVDVEEAVPAGSTFVPDPGGSRLLMGEFPPDSTLADPSFDLMTAVGEQLAAMPGLADRFEPDNPGMHVTPTVDYAIVISGDVVLDLGDGTEVALRPGDVVVQQMTRHAWRVRGSEPARIAFCLLGTDATR